MTQVDDSEAGRIMTVRHSGADHDAAIEAALACGTSLNIFCAEAIRRMRESVADPDVLAELRIHFKQEAEARREAMKARRQSLPAHRQGTQSRR